MTQLPHSLRAFFLRVTASAFVIVLIVGALNSASYAALGTASPTNPLIMGANQSLANYDNPMHSNSFHALSRNLNIQNARYVGGSPASFWDWNPGRFVPASEMTAIWPNPWFGPISVGGNGASDWVNAQPAGTFSVDAMAAAAAAENIATVQWTPNLTTRENDQAAMITYLHNQGYDFSRIEADNEAYFWGNEFAALGGGAEYGRRIATKLAPTVRSLNPNAQIGANFLEGEFFTGHSAGGWQANWNSGVWSTRNYGSPATPNFDALILHHYAMNSDALSGFSSTTRTKAFLAFPEATLERAAARSAAAYGDLPIWVTEYNVIAYTGSGGGDNGTWIRGTKNTGWNALYNAGFYLTALSNPDDITVLNHHEILGAGNGWGLGETVSTTSGKISPSGVIFSHVADLVSQADETIQVIPDTNPSLGVTVVGDSTLKVFQAAGLKNNTDGVLNLLVMNRDGASRDFELSNYGTYGRIDIVTYRAEDTDATAFKSVQLDTATPIYAQAAAPFNPTKSGFALTPGQALDISLPQYSFSILTLSQLVTGLAGDFDSDGDVDGRDFLVWQRNPAVGSLSSWQANYGMSQLTASAHAVPEPAAGLLLLMGIAGLSFRRTAR